MTIKQSRVYRRPVGTRLRPVGNVFRDMPEEEADATIDSALSQGTRSFDTAPFYGAGLSDTREAFEPLMAGEARDRIVLDADFRLEQTLGRGAASCRALSEV